jgi:hypothetical protein
MEMLFPCSQGAARLVNCPVSSAEEAEKVHKPFSKQQDAIAYAAACNQAAAPRGSSEDDPNPVPDIVKVGSLIGGKLLKPGRARQCTRSGVLRCFQTFPFKGWRFSGVRRYRAPPTMTQTPPVTSLRSALSWEV